MEHKFFQKLDGVTYYFDYFETESCEDVDWKISREIMQEINNDFKRRNDIIVIRKKNSILDNIIDELHGKYDIIIYLGDENPHCSKVNPDLTIFTQYWNNSLQKNIHFWPVFCDNNELTNKEISKETTKDIDIYFSGNLNKNRLIFYSSLIWPFNLSPKISNYILKAIFNSYVKKILVWMSKFRSRQNGVLINFTNAFGSGFSVRVFTQHLRRSKFALCPKGFSSAWTFRLNEAIQCDCVPVIVRDEFENTVQPPALVLKSWCEINKYDHEKLDQIYKIKVKEINSFKEKWFNPSFLGKYVTRIQNKP